MATTTFTNDRARWLTVERLAYLLLFLIPTVIRLVNLGTRTFAPAEAETAWRAWQASQGLHPQLDAGQPLLFSLQKITFFVMGATDATARAWPLLAAAGIPLVMYWTRHWLGRRQALAAALLMALSPTINAFARRADGVTFALLGASLALAGLAFLQGQRRGGWKAIAVGMALLLLSGPAGFSVLLPLFVVMFLTLRTVHSRTSPTVEDWTLFGVVLILGGTAFLTQVDALGLTAINLTQWMGDFTLQPQQWLLGWVRLAVDEPLLSLFGLIGILWGFRRSGQIRIFAVAATVAGAIAIFQGPDVSYSRAVAAFFFAFPSAAYLVHLVSKGGLRFYSLEESLLVVVLILLAFLSTYALASFAASGDFSRLIIFFVSVFLALVMIVIFLFFIGKREVSAALHLAALILTLLFGLGSLWSLGFNSVLPTMARVYPTEALPDVKDIVRTYGDLSEHQRGDRWALSLTIIPGSASDDLLQWYFRDGEDVRVQTHLPTDSPPPVIIAPEQRTLTLDGFAGQRFALLTDWDIGRVTTTNQGIYWFLFRRAPFPPPAVDAVNLWVNLDLLSLQQSP